MSDEKISSIFLKFMELQERVRVIFARGDRPSRDLMGLLRRTGDEWESSKNTDRDERSDWNGS